ncbi:MAG: hypothetical protein AAGC92_00490 [Pseudomonadota bacterium]
MDARAGVEVLKPEKSCRNTCGIAPSGRLCNPVVANGRPAARHRRDRGRPPSGIKDGDGARRHGKGASRQAIWRIPDMVEGGLILTDRCAPKVANRLPLGAEDRAALKRVRIPVASPIGPPDRRPSRGTTQKRRKWAFKMLRGWSGLSFMRCWVTAAPSSCAGLSATIAPGVRAVPSGFVGSIEEYHCPARNDLKGQNDTAFSYIFIRRGPLRPLQNGVPFLAQPDLDWCDVSVGRERRHQLANNALSGPVVGIEQRR